MTDGFLPPEHPPVIEPLPGGRYVVRDDRIIGGTKARIAAALMAGHDEVVYAGPASGYAQLALAVGTARSGVRSSVFVPWRKEPADLSRTAAMVGARLVQVRAGRLNVLEHRAARYAEIVGATVVPLGLRFPEGPGLAPLLAPHVADIEPPPELWLAAGSGALTEAFSTLWPSTRVYAVRVGLPPRWAPTTVTLLRVPEAFHDPARIPPPVPSVPTYDAKVWRHFQDRAAPGALWWNVAGPVPSPSVARKVLDL